MSAPPKPVHIQYFALLREERGLSSEGLLTDARTPRELYSLLQREYRFSLPQERLQVAVNEGFSGWDAELQPNDRVVFIPPVAGG